MPSQGMDLDGTHSSWLYGNGYCRKLAVSIREISSFLQLASLAYSYALNLDCDADGALFDKAIG